MTRLIGVNDKGYRVGKYHHSTRIRDETVNEIRELRESAGWTIDQLCAHFHLSNSTIRKIVYYERRAQTPVAFRRVDELRNSRWRSKQPEDPFR